jgi:hypothetical protein
VHSSTAAQQHSSTAARHLQERMTSRHDARHKYTNTKYRKKVLGFNLDKAGHLPAGASEQQLDVVEDLLRFVKSYF